MNRILLLALPATLGPLASCAWAQEDPWARGLRLALPHAVPEQDRPRRFIIADAVVGPRKDDRVALENGLRMHAALGNNTIHAREFGSLDPQIPAIAKKYGLAHTTQGVYKPLNGVDKEGAYFSWSSSANDPAAIQAWTRQIADYGRKFSPNLSDINLFHLADEPGWYFPYIFSAMVANQGRMQKFHAYLQKQGLRPGDVGAGSWNEVRPIGLSQANDLSSRRLYYWSIRYTTDSFSDGIRTWSNSIRAEYGPQARTTTNWGNILGRWYAPSPGVKWANNSDTGPDSGQGMPDWMDVARARGVTALWTEDWFGDRGAQFWTMYGDALRAAQVESHLAAPPKGPSQVLDRANVVRVAKVDVDFDAPEFGGYIVGRTISSTWGARLKAMSLLSRGAKIIQWYTFGPHERFSDGWSKVEAAYGAIASTNRLIGRSEDLLYPGRRPQSRIAIMLPQSAYAWDKTPGMPLYLHEIRCLHPGLTNNGWPVDFVDETNVANGDLQKRGYALVHVTSPNLSARAQAQLREWIRGGGTAVFSPGAASSDEYNTPTSTLDEVRGVRVRPVDRWAMNDGIRERHAINFSAREWGSDITVSRPLAPLDIAGANVAATSKGEPVLAHKRFGSGLAVTYGFWPGVTYSDTNLPGYGPVARGNNPGLSHSVTAAARVTRLAKPIDTGMENVEAARLDSDAGSAVVLLNWTREARQNVSVLVRNAGEVRSVESAERGRLQFTREGTGVRVSVPLGDVDVLMLRR